MIKLYNVSEVASTLGLSISCVYKKAEKGEIQSIKIGTALRFSESDVQNFLEKCRKPDVPVFTATEKIDYNTFDYLVNQ
ncbi:MAG: helix-turn-helix domain-containing protein [Clostridiales bacterium]|jgi:excisionase family DNA binding protein|nr:helix-turn-helix domain-containing protein [Clostridiales bacterium]